MAASKRCTKNDIKTFKINSFGSLAEDFCSNLTSKPNSNCLIKIQHIVSINKEMLTLKRSTKNEMKVATINSFVSLAACFNT